MTIDSVGRLDSANLDAPAEKDGPSKADLAPQADTVTNIDAPKADTVTSIDVPKMDTVTDSTPKPEDARTPDVAPKPDTITMCSYEGKTYAIGQTALVGACTSCICQSDGTLGRCIGTCIDGGPIIDPAELCMSTGGYVIEQQCCSETIDFPDTCGIGYCGCGFTGHFIQVCQCPDSCFVPTQGCVPVTNADGGLK